VIHQVGSVEAAVLARRPGVDVIIAQGVEAGGHVAGTIFPKTLRTSSKSRRAERVPNNDHFAELYAGNGAVAQRLHDLMGNEGGGRYGHLIAWRV